MNHAYSLGPPRNGRRVKTTEEVKKIGKEKILEFLGIELTPTRLKCALLPLEVFQNTLALVK